MNTEDSLVMQGVKIEMASLVFEIQKLRVEIERKERLKDIPEWLTLEMAASLKGGAALDTYKTKLFLQPCCGINYRLVGGRKCWRREEVIRWLSVSDKELKNYAAEWRVAIPENYERRSN